MPARVRLDHNLLDPLQDALEAPANFAACLNARGLYNTFQFVLRLSPRVHQLIDAIPSGIYAASDLDPETLQAYSTYLHETVHWWQHMGSTTGLVISLGYPAQWHFNLDELRTVLDLIGPKKSIKRWAEATALAGAPATDPALQAANVAVNNAIDIEFFKLFAMRPDLASDLFADRYFESVGHCYRVAYTQALSVVAATLDHDFEYLPNERRWNPEFDRLMRERFIGFYRGSPIMVGPVGVRALFEGQARFIQMQYLAFGEHGLSCETLRRHGYFDGVYGEAFEAFLRLTGSDWPDRIEHPLVALFLLICDLAINPAAGFPCDIEVFESFIVDVDPGIRFGRLCDVVTMHHPELRTAITDYSRDEYVAVATALTQACGYNHPLCGLETVARWTSEARGVIEVMAEKDSFNFALSNLPIRVIASHFVAFSADKLARPEFFCWTGAWMSGSRTSRNIQELFLRHLSLFADRADSDGVFARDFPGKDREGLVRTLNYFYSNNVVYDLTRQWILEDGPFRYDYRWLSQTNKTGWAKATFEQYYGVGPDAFQVL